MPDPELKTVSASQAAALFNLSPYTTRYMLHHHFTGAADLIEPDNSRVDFGKRLQRPILELTADRMGLEVIENADEIYQRHADAEHVPIGCTTDASIIDPGRGEGIVQAKNVDWKVWAESWTRTKAPAYIEIQAQVEMAVTGAQWGVIAALVGGNELRLYPRTPEMALIDRVATEAARFMEAVANDDAPPPEGLTVELDTIDQLYPSVEETETLTRMDDEALAELMARLAWGKRNAAFHNKLCADLQTKLLAIAEHHGRVRAHGHLAYISKADIDGRISRLPPDITTTLYALTDTAAVYENKELLSAIMAALNWYEVIRKPSVRSAISIQEIDDGPSPFDILPQEET